MIVPSSFVAICIVLLAVANSQLDFNNIPGLNLGPVGSEFEIELTEQEATAVPSEPTGINWDSITLDFANEGSSSTTAATVTVQAPIPVNEGLDFQAILEFFGTTTVATPSSNVTKGVSSTITTTTKDPIYNITFNEGFNFPGIVDFSITTTTMPLSSGAHDGASSTAAVYTVQDPIYNFTLNEGLNFQGIVEYLGTTTTEAPNSKANGEASSTLAVTVGDTVYNYSLAEGALELSRTTTTATPSIRANKSSRFAAPQSVDSESGTSYHFVLAAILIVLILVLTSTWLQFCLWWRSSRTEQDSRKENEDGFTQHSSGAAESADQEMPESLQLCCENNV